MPAPLIIPFLGAIGGAIGGLFARTSITAALSTIAGYSVVLLRRLLTSKLVQGALLLWVVNKSTQLVTNQTTTMGAVKVALQALLNYTDGKVIGQFPPEMQPKIAFFNYWFPISETLAIVGLLSAVFLACVAFQLAVAALRVVKSIAHNESG